MKHYRYGYYLDSTPAKSFEEACEIFAERFEDFDEDEVWSDSDDDD